MRLPGRAPSRPPVFLGLELHLVSVSGRVVTVRLNTRLQITSQRIYEFIEEESDFDESGSESLVESEDDDAGDTDNDDEGMEWDELEEEAQAADEDASDSEDMKRKRWSGSKKRI